MTSHHRSDILHQSYDFIMSPGGKTVPEDPNPGPVKLKAVADGFILHNVTGIRTRIVSRLDGKGYDITKRMSYFLLQRIINSFANRLLVGPHAVRSGQVVHVNDPALLRSFPESLRYRSQVVRLRIFLDTVDPAGATALNGETYITAYTAEFGADSTVIGGTSTLRPGHGEGTMIHWDKNNPHGCKPYETEFDGDAVLVHRGDCTFLEKLVYARDAGASGVIVVSDDDAATNPSASPEEIAAAGDIDDIALVLLPHSVGRSVAAMVGAAGTFGYGHVMVAVEPEAQTIVESVGQTPGEIGQILYINGHPLLNTRLML